MPTYPPPSPIPTGKGLRSAANPTLSRHLIGRSAEIPKLSLPGRIQSHLIAPDSVDLGSILRIETHAVNMVLKSAAGSGVFWITGHGVSVDGVRSELTKSSVAGSEEFVWRPLMEWAAEPAWKIIKRENWRNFSQKMETIRNELERISSQVAQVLYENSNKQIIHEGIKTIDLVLSVHSGDLFVGGSSSNYSEENFQACTDYAFSLHLPLEQFEFRVHSKQGILSFSANPQTILVTIGKELEDWSHGQFKSAHGELKFVQSFSANKSSFCIELKCPLSIPILRECMTNRTISITDQIVLMIAIPILYTMLLFIFF